MRHAGAVEMYNLDANESVQQIPWDKLVDGVGTGIVCKVHGDVYGNQAGANTNS